MRFVVTTVITTTIKLDDNGELTVTDHNASIDASDIGALPDSAIRGVVAGACESLIANLKDATRREAEGSDG